MVGCGSPHQHDGFLPDLLGLNCLLVLTTCRSEDVGRAERRQSGNEERIVKSRVNGKGEAEEKSQEAERQTHILLDFMCQQLKTA